MTNEELLREISSLPAEAKIQVERFVAQWTKRVNANENVKKRPLQEEEFVGMWADREDMKDPVEWVRNLRKTHWDRNNK